MSTPTTTAGSTKSEAGTPADHERRTSIRHRIRVRAIYQTADARTEDFWWYANILDISCGGLSAHVLRRWEPGTLLATEPMLPPVGSPTDFPRCQVVHVNRSPEGGWILGCEFTAPLREDQLTALLRENESV
jgi:PilZ domain